MSAPSRVEMRWTGAHAFEGGRAGSPSIRLDAAAERGPSPVDGLLAALASCVSVDVVDILAKRRTPLESLRVEVVGERVDTIPRRLRHVTLNVHLAGEGIERVHAERAVELAVTKYCSVRDSLREDIPVDWTVTLHAPGAGSE